MSTFAIETRIEAPADAVWRVLADIGNIYEWNPGVIRSHTTSNGVEGMGATRTCDLGGNNFLDEEVVAWEPGEQLTMRVVCTSLPFKTADIRFHLDPIEESTLVTLSPQYSLKYGPLGSLMDRFYVRGAYEEGMRKLLQGLKQHVEGAAVNAAG